MWYPCTMFFPYYGQMDWVHISFLGRVNVVPLYDAFSVLRPDGLGPHFLPREGECGNPRTMFFPY